MLRVEAVIFASAEPVSRETLERVVGKDCSIDLLIHDLREELSSRPYELVSVAGGWQHRTRPRFSETIHASPAPTRGGAAALSEFEATVLMAVGYFQPVTRGELSKIFGKEVSRDVIGNLRGAGFIGWGPRSPTPGAPYAYVTTQHLVSAFGVETLRDLPNIEALEDAGLLSRRGMRNEIAGLRRRQRHGRSAPYGLMPVVCGGFTVLAATQIRTARHRLRCCSNQRSQDYRGNRSTRSCRSAPSLRIRQDERTERDMPPSKPSSSSLAQTSSGAPKLLSGGLKQCLLGRVLLDRNSTR